MTQPDKTIGSFVFRALAAVMPPLILLVAAYAILDPFGVLRGDTRQQLRDNDVGIGRLQTNKGLISLAALDERVAQGDIPDTFIFGSSISCYYRADTLRALTGTPTMPLHFDSSDEGVGSLRLKLEYLRRKGIEVKQALVVTDPISVMRPVTGEQTYSAEPPAIAGPAGSLKWHSIFFNTFCDFSFLQSYLPWLVTGDPVEYSGYHIFESQPYVYDLYRNEESIPQWDAEIKERPDSFYAVHELPAVRRFHCSDEARIDAAHERELRLIRELLNGSDYHIVVSPTITLDTLSRRDDALMREIFGEKRYHNYSAAMDGIALNDSNWYDSRHYREPAATAILRRVYWHMDE